MAKHPHDHNHARSKGADDHKPSEDEVEEIKRQAEEALGLLAPIMDLLPKVLNEIPRGKLVEQLRLGDRRAYARYFKGFRPQKIPRSRIHRFMVSEIEERENGVLGHLLIVLWNTSREDVYDACKDSLKVVNPDVTKIEHVDAITSKVILTKLLADFGLEDITLVVALNEARFDRGTLEEMIPDRDWSRAPAGPPES
jgi:hypothetical protein